MATHSIIVIHDATEVRITFGYMPGLAEDWSGPAEPSEAALISVHVLAGNRWVVADMHDWAADWIESNPMLIDRAVADDTERALEARFERRRDYAQERA